MGYSWKAVVRESKGCSPGMRDHYVLCGITVLDVLNLDDEHSSPKEVRDAILELQKARAGLV
jgi:hypothetical protein